MSGEAKPTAAEVWNAAVAAETPPPAAPEPTPEPVVPAAEAAPAVPPVEVPPVATAAPAEPDMSPTQIVQALLELPGAKDEMLKALGLTKQEGKAPDAAVMAAPASQNEWDGKRSKVLAAADKMEDDAKDALVTLVEAMDVMVAKAAQTEKWINEKATERYVERIEAEITDASARLLIDGRPPTDDEIDSTLEWMKTTTAGKSMSVSQALRARYEGATMRPSGAPPVPPPVVPRVPAPTPAATVITGSGAAGSPPAPTEGAPRQRAPRDADTLVKQWVANNGVPRS